MHINQINANVIINSGIPEIRPWAEEVHPFFIYYFWVFLSQEELRESEMCSGEMSSALRLERSSFPDATAQALRNTAACT